MAASCAEQRDRADACTQPTETYIGLGSIGQGRVFHPDPIIGSGLSSLLPTSSQLDLYAETVELTNLKGRGVLDGSLVSVRSGNVCGEGFGAISADQQFLYSHSDERFQEVSVYHASDRFRSVLQGIDSLLPASPIRVVVHCMQEDNAYYQKVRNFAGQVTAKVCLGDSVSTPGASYSDDSTVVVHELQHATTGDTYSTEQDLNQFWYDEAGALNEALSDFMALGFYAPVTSDALDPRYFSRWALGTFGSRSYMRGAHRCPRFDPSFPACDGFAPGADGFSSADNRISYSYPDGMGWPYANNFNGPGFVRDAFNRYLAQEQIHNSATLMTGALWDVYSALKDVHGGDADEAFRLSARVALEALKLLPKPSPSTFWSPVTYRGYAEAMMLAAQTLEPADQGVIETALTARGLLGGQSLGTGWASVGPGYLGGLSEAPSPGIHVQDNPATLKNWLESMGVDPAVVTHSATTADNKLNSGEVAAIWLDIQNNSNVTAGGVNIVLQSLSSDLTFLRYPYNVGAVNTSQVQIQYQKVNGTDIVASLATGDSSRRVSTRNSYFGTNPYYFASYTTAVWVRAGAASSGVKTIRATITPSNGQSTVVDFTVMVQ